MKPSNEQILRDALQRIIENHGNWNNGIWAANIATAALAATAPESAPADAQSTAERTQQHNQLLLLRYSNWTEFKEMATLNRVQGTADEFLHLGFRAGYACTRPAPSQSGDQVRDVTEKMQAARAALSDMFQAVEAYEDACNTVGGDPDQFWTKAKEAADRAHQWLLLDVQPCLERQRILATSSAAKGEAAPEAALQALVDQSQELGLYDAHASDGGAIQLASLKSEVRRNEFLAQMHWNTVEAQAAAIDAAEDLMDVIDRYPEQLVPINRKSVTCNILRAAIASLKKEGE